MSQMRENVWNDTPFSHHGFLSRSIVPPFAPADFQLIFAAPLINSAAHCFVDIHDFIQPSLARENRPQTAIVVPRIDSLSIFLPPFSAPLSVYHFCSITESQYKKAIKKIPHSAPAEQGTEAVRGYFYASLPFGTCLPSWSISKFSR